MDHWCAEAGTPGRLFVDQRERDLHGRTHRPIVAVHDNRPGSPETSVTRVVERPYFHDSSRSNHIQLADIIAYNVLRRFRNGDPNYPYFTRILPKLRCSTSCGGDGLALYA
ncbi:MAG: DUF3800 domain-containing protein [Candidatus Eremiobacteraeota bacterium]|nr:DUF3800 domain-containing protein [Candidatus Eremiobacteraeota bacterium]